MTLLIVLAALFLALLASAALDGRRGLGARTDGGQPARSGLQAVAYRDVLRLGL